ncbi:MAG: hypothetical protein A2Y81_12970 [Nitrospirae bacterium RBG_13_43_8]|nr:MAG: hypothetical protein A2Y81_12970 [Nitrospirae bacterium RBG_13_43_8]
MAKKSIEDVINSLSEEEKENFKDLIRETLDRDRTIKENAEKALKALKSFSEYSHLLQSLEEEKAALRRIKEELQLIRYTMYLTAIPDSKFHRA